MTDKHADEGQNVENESLKRPKDEEKDLELADEDANDVRGGIGPDKPPEKFYIK